MKKNSIPFVVCAALTALTAMTPERALGQPLYFDDNGNTVGAGGPNISAAWSGTKWTTLSLGNSTTAGWNDNRTAIFSAGSDATGTVQVNIGGTRALTGLTVEEGAVDLQAGTITLSGSVDVQVGASLTFSAGGIVDGTSGLTKVGSGDLTFSGTGNNNYTGTTTINGGTLKVSSTANKIHDDSLVALTSGAVFHLTSNETVGGLAGTAGLVTNTAVLTLNVTNSSVTFSGTNVGTGSIIKTGAGEQNFSAASTFTGGLGIYEGTFGYGNPNILADTLAVLVKSNAILNLYGNSDTIGSLNGSNGAVIIFNNGALTVGGGNGGGTYSGSLNGSFSSQFIKTGTGALIVNGNTNSSYSGSVTVNGGALVLGNTSDSPLGSANVTVNSSAKLAGSGRMTGSVILNSGAKIAPGASPGTIETGAETWEGGASYEFEINDATGNAGADPGWDLISLTGYLTINATTANKFTIRVKSLTTGNVAGDAVNFDNTSDYVWKIAGSSFGVSGFDKDKFIIDVSEFSNDRGTGVFALAVIGNDLYLKFVHPPSVVSGPDTSRTYAAGSTVFFNIDAGGTAPFSYQWQRNGIDIATATSSSFSLNNVQLSDSADYSIIISNAYGMTTSTPPYSLYVVAPTCSPGLLSVNALGWWQGEFGSYDQLGLNDAIENGSVNYSETSKVGTAFELDGLNDYIYVAAPTGMNIGTGDFSLEGWVQTAGANSYNAIASFDSFNPGIYIRNSGQLELFDSGVGTIGTTSESLADNQYHHIAVVRQGGFLRFYVDGAQVLGPITYNEFISPSNFYIGWDGSSGYFSGRLDEIALYNKALTANEITSIYQADSGGKCYPQCNPTSLDAEAWYKAEGNGDDIVNGYNGIVGSSTTFESGLVGQAFRFNGTANAFVSATLGVTSAVYAVEAWIKPSALAGSRNTVIEFGSNELWFGIKNNQAIEFASNGETVITAGTVNLNEWSHIAYTWDGVHSRLYKNGTLLSENQIDPVAMGGQFAIGYNSVLNDPFDGWVDELTIYSQSLMPEEIQSIYSGYELGKCGVPPQITLDPVSTTNNAGGSAVFTVTASGTPPLYYQWFKFGTAYPLVDGANVSGATASTVTLMNITADDMANYYVRVTNSGGLVYSANAFLTVNDPYIYSQPTNVTATAFSTAVFTVGAAGVAPLSYQWRRGSTDLINNGLVFGATSPSLTIYLGQGGEDAEPYTCVITNTYIKNGEPYDGIVVSDPATLVIVDPPQIVVNAPNRTNLPGATVTFSNVVSGTKPFYYKWFKDGNPVTSGTVISNQTSSVLILSGITAADAGMYSLQVTNISGQSAFAFSELIVATAVQITNQPPLLTTTNAGSFFSISVGAQGGGLAYQWTRNGTNLTDNAHYSGVKTATLFVYDVSDLDEDIDTSAYKCKVSNIATPAGVTSANARLSVVDPWIFNQPMNQVVHLGGSAAFSVFASGYPNFFYQWRKGNVNLVNGPNVSGATSQFLNLNNITAAEYGSYNCIVLNSNVPYSGAKRTTPGFIVSSNASLIQMQAPTIAVQPPSTLIKPLGANPSISVTADGTGPYYFEWRKNGVKLNDGPTGYGSFVFGSSASFSTFGQQMQFLSLNGLVANDAGQYDVVISNNAGAITSSVVNLIVSNEPPVVAISHPTNNHSIPAPAYFTVNVSATDGTDGWVTNVVLKMDDQVVGSAEFGFPSFSMQNLSAADYTFVAIATDNLGVSSTSAPVTVHVTSDCVLPPDGIISWWRGENNANDFYGNNNGVENGGVSYAPGKTTGGNAFVFNGTSSYVDMGNPSQLQITGNITLECWFKTTEAVGSYKTLVSKWDTGGSTGSYALYWKNTEGEGLGFHVRNLEGQVVSANSFMQLNDGLWHHVAGVWNGSQARIFIDGIERGSATGSFFGTLADTSHPVRIGANSSTYSDHYFSGNIDEVSIYNRALDIGEVQSIYAAGVYGKCLASAKLVFGQPFGGAGDQRGNGIAISGGSLYVAGSVAANGGDGMVAKLPIGVPTVIPTWMTVWPGLAGGDHFNAVAISPEAVYVVGDSYGRTQDSSDSGTTTLGAKDAKGMLVKFPFSGTGGAGFGGSVWDKQTPKPPGAFSFGGPEKLKSAIAVTEGEVNYVYAIGSGQNTFGNSNRFFMVKMRQDSTNMWTVKDTANAGGTTTTSGGGTTGNAYSEGRGIAALNGSIYVAGRSDDFGYPIAFLRKYAPNGTNLWSLPWFSGQFNGVAVHGGAIYTVGQTAVDAASTSGNTYATNSQFMVVKWSEFGYSMWYNAIGVPGYDECVLNSVVGMRSRIYAVGSARNTTTMTRDAVMLEINPQDGAILSTNIHSVTMDQWANGVATDGDDLYVIGETETVSDGRDVLLLRYKVSQPLEPLQMITTSLPYGEVDKPYNAILAAVGGRPFYNWSWEIYETPSFGPGSGKTPSSSFANDLNGLTLSQNGIITGVPEVASNMTVVVVVTDSANPSQSVTQNLTLVIVNSNTLPTVSFTTPSDGTSYTTPSYTNVVNVNFTVTASDSDGSVTKVELYKGVDFVDSIVGSPTYYNFSVNDLTPGSYTFTAVAYDDLGATNTSSKLHIRVDQYGTSVIDFEVLDTSATPVSGTTLSNYLWNYGVVVSNHTAGSTISANNDLVFSSGVAVRASSGHNFLGQLGKNGKVSYRINFQNGSLASFGFTRVKQLASATGTVLPQWRATAYDSSGTELGSVGEDFSFSYSDILEQSFTLYGPNGDIAWVQIDSDNRNYNLNSVLFDDFVLGTILTHVAPFVAITNPVYGAQFAAPATLTVVADADPGSSPISKVEFYVDNNFIESVATTNTANVTLSGLAAGTYNLRAVARDEIGAARSSTPVSFTVTNAPGISVINFDWTNAATRNVGGQALSNYLASYGVTITNVTGGSRVEAADVGNLYGGQSVAAVSPRNILSQFGRSGPVSFTLKFTTPLESVKFTRPALLAGANGITHPEWVARAFDASGNELTATSEGVIHSFSNVPAQPFELAASGIASVRFTSDGKNRTAFAALLVDDLVLNTNTVIAPLEISITSPVDLASYAAPANITITADATNHFGAVDHVQFYANSSFIGYDLTYPYTLNWPNVLPGTYELLAIVVASDGTYRISDPVSVSVTGTVGNTTIIDFDGVSATSADVNGAALNGYLAGYGLSVSADIYSQVNIRDQNNFFYGNGVRAASGANVFVQESFYGVPTDFTFYLNQAATNFTFTRPKLISRYYSPITQPRWTATAYDSAGNVLTSTGEGAIFSYADVDAQQFTLAAGGISYVNFHLENNNYTYLNSLAIDDIVLRRSAGNLPPSVAIVEPTTASYFVSPADVVLTANAVDPDGSITAVEFYNNGASLIQSDSTAPYSITWSNLAVGKYRVVARAIDDNSATSEAEITFRVRPKPSQFGIISDPQDQTAASGDTVQFTVGTTGVGSPTFEWYYSFTQSLAGAVIISGATSSTLTLTNIDSGDQGYYYALVRSATNATLVQTSEAAHLTILNAPVITTQPSGQNVNSGDDISFTVDATGTAPLTYQWFLNGSKITDETNAALSIINVQPFDAGNYYVVVKNNIGSAKSDIANLQVLLGNGELQTADNFADRISINPLFSATFGNNCEATAEPGEPSHVSKPGGKSIWYTWHATFNGTVSITTKGSSFDTLLAVYTGSDVASLTEVTSDDDSGGNLTSQVTFNCEEGVDYIFAVDGFYGACGNVVIGLPSGGYRVLDSAANNEAIPEITSQPLSQSVTNGGTLTLNVVADSPVAMTYQWFYNLVPILDETNSTLEIEGFTSASVGRYSVVVANEFGSVESTPADVQLIEADVTNADTVGSRDKFGDATEVGIEEEGLRAPTPANGKAPSSSATGTSRSFTSSQIFSTVGATKEPGEPNHCGEPGGASQWFIYAAPTNGTLHINTDGSTFNTVIAVYVGSGFDFDDLTLLACANNSSGNGSDFLRTNAVQGTTYFIAVDGVGGASGTVKLNISVGESPTLTQQPQSRAVATNSSTTFTTTFVGSTNITFQWKFNGANIASATGSAYTKNNIQNTDAGAYTVVLSNAINVVTSSVASLVLEGPPLVGTAPASRTIDAGKNLTLSVALSQGTAPYTYFWRKNGEIVATHTSSTPSDSLAFTPIQTTNYGDYDVVITNAVENGAITSAVASIIVNVPLPTISLPKNKATVTTAANLFTGKSATNALVTQIAYRVNTDLYTGMVTGVENWSANIPATAGTNIVEFRSTDINGSNSAWAARTIFYETTSTFNLEGDTHGNAINALGTPPPTDGATLVVGKPIKMKAVLNYETGWILTNWTATWLGQGAQVVIETNNLTLNTLMRSNLTVYANFVPNLFLTNKGVYNGLFREADAVRHTSAGSISLKVTEKFSYSGKLLVDGDSISISGKFRIDGTADATGKRLLKLDKPDLAVHLDMNFPNGGNVITGTIANVSGPWSSTFVADRQVWTTNSPATLYSNAYTMIIPGFDSAATGPQGWGYASVIVDHLGTIKVAGTTADGLAIKQKTTLSADGDFPFFAPLYLDGEDMVNSKVVKRTRGELIGWLNFAANTDAYADNTNLAPIGSVYWFKTPWTNTSWTAGFTNQVTLASSVHKPPTMISPIYPFTNTLVEMSLGALAESFTNQAPFSPIKNAFVVNTKATNAPYPYTNKFKISLANKTGVLTGTFTNATSTTILKWSGAMLQDYNAGYGFFINTNTVNASGKVNVVPADEE